MGRGSENRTGTEAGVTDWFKTEQLKKRPNGSFDEVAAAPRLEFKHQIAGTKN